jgi:hypothetical protein
VAPEPEPSDIQLIMLALSKERLCVSCLVARTGIPKSRIEEPLMAVGGVLMVRRAVAACEQCSGTTDVFTLV